MYCTYYTSTYIVAAWFYVTLYNWCEYRIAENYLHWTKISPTPVIFSSIYMYMIVNCITSVVLYFPSYRQGYTADLWWRGEWLPRPRWPQRSQGGESHDTHVIITWLSLSVYYTCTIISLPLAQACSGDAGARDNRGCLWSSPCGSHHMWVSKKSGICKSEFMWSFSWIFFQLMDLYLLGGRETKVC